MTKVFFNGSPGWRFASDSPSRVLSTCALDEVIPLVRTVEEATAAGSVAVLMLSYEAAAAFDNALTTHPAGSFPLAWAAIFESSTNGSITTGANYSPCNWQPLITREHYGAAIEKVRELIARGDTYQVNFTVPFTCDFDGEPLAWYLTLCEAQEVLYPAYLDLGRYQILSLSPELFFKRAGRSITTRPMKGTIARGRWLEEDKQMAERLSCSQKDRAENIMIVDLLRNDLSKVARLGSVQVNDLFKLERYETLWQMTSTVKAELVNNAGLVEVLKALFPCGSITGAPKVRTMQIIHELEPHPRNVFTGTIGLIQPGGDCCFNVAIRTVVIDSETQRATFGVGGGVTWDSTDVAEYEEILTKSAFLSRPRRDFQLLESLLLKDGRIFLLDRHLQRLQSSSEFFGFTFDWTKVNDKLDQMAVEHASGSWKLRLLLSKDGGTDVQTTPLGKTTRLLSVALDSVAIDDRDPFMFHKTTHRSRYDEAMERNPHVDDVLLWNERGELTESTIANLVVPIEGRFYTPRREAGLLDGTLRSELLQNGTIRERTIMKSELNPGTYLYLINSLRGWMPARLTG